MKDLLTRIHKASAARRISRLSEEQAAKVLAYMEELEAQPTGNTKGSFAASGNGGTSMRKIALRGMIGRKRDTVLLWTVIVLAFLFLALPTTLITSLNATDAAARVETYGKWQVMAAGLPWGRAGNLAASYGEGAVATPLVEVSGADYFQGDNTYLLGVYSPELAEMGSLQLREGHWPEAEDEIVVEYARLASLGLEVGDTFAVQSQTDLPMTVEHVAANRQAFEDEYEAQVQRMTDLYYNGDWEFIPDYESYYYSGPTIRLGEEDFWLFSNWWNGHYDTVDIQQEAGFLIFWSMFHEQWRIILSDLEHPEGQVVPLDELTDEQFATALSVYVNVEYLPQYVSISAEKIDDLIGVDGLSVRVSGTDAPGAMDPLEMRIISKYTICGVIDTYTDHWDSGNADLPSGFMTQEAFQKLQACQEAALEKYPDYQSVDYDSLVLRSGSGEASEVWKDSLGTYNRAVLDAGEFTALTYQSRLVNPVYTTEGVVSSYESATGQIVFRFMLTDPAQPQRSGPDGFETVSAWLVPASIETLSGEAYIYDRPLDEGIQETTDTIHTWLTGSITDLVETGENMVMIGEKYTEYDSEGNPTNTSINAELMTMDLEGAVVRFDLRGQRYDIPLEDFIAGNFSVDGLVPVDAVNGAFLEDLSDQDEFLALRVNRYAYPASAESTGSMLMLVMGMLFVTTVCAVFQICFTQIRKRMRRVVLLKSLGAETKQIAGMMFWEFLYFWVTALPIGAALGLGGAWLATTVLSSTQDRTVLLTIEPAVLLLALLAGTLALAVGMMIPAIMAVGVPLTGRTVRRKPMVPPKKDVRQDFFHVSLRGLAAKKGRTIGSFALCAFMMTITVLCLFLGFRFLGEYRDTVIRDGKPDYLLRSPYAMSNLQREEYLAELEELGVCGSVTSYFVGEDIDLGGESLEESYLFTIAAEDGASCEVDLYTLSSEDALFADFQATATVGKLDEKAFDDGQQVLLAVPLYRDTGKVNEGALASAESWDRLAASGIETTFLPEYDGVFQRDEAVQVGDLLQLSMVTTSIREESYVTSENTAEVTVGAILYYFPDTGIWPLSGSEEGYQVVGSLNLLRDLLPSAGKTRQDQGIRAIYLQQRSLHAMSGVYGATDFYITAAEDVDQETADTALLVFARNHYMDIEVYHESNTTLLRNAVSNILLACLLGMSAVLLALVIFYNTVSSDIEQERPKIGILQSLGVSNRRFAARQAAIGGVASAIAVVVANVLLWGGVILFVCATGTVLGNLLWGYPTAWHVCLCAALACILISLFVLPMRNVGRYLPIENIRSKN